MSFPEKFPQKESPDTLSVTSRTTSNYFPQSYKRPAPYLLWDDNIVPIHYSSKARFPCCRLFLGLLIAVAAIGVVVVISVAVYLGVITNHMMEEVTNDQTFDGKFKVTSGDTYVEELEDTSSLEFQLKAKKYETMINMLMKSSQLNEGYKESEVTGFRLGSLIVFFRVHLDRRKLVDLQDDVTNVLENVIAEDATRFHPRVLKDIEVDLDSIIILDAYPKKKVATKTKFTHKETKSNRLPANLDTTTPHLPLELTTEAETPPSDDTTEPEQELEIISDRNTRKPPRSTTKRLTAGVHPVTSSSAATDSSTSSRATMEQKTTPATPKSTIASKVTTSGTTSSSAAPPTATATATATATVPTATASASTTASSDVSTSKSQFIQSIINSLIQRLADNTTVDDGYVQVLAGEDERRRNDSSADSKLPLGAWRPPPSPAPSRIPTQQGITSVRPANRGSLSVPSPVAPDRRGKPSVGAGSVPKQRAEALTSGVAQEIPFSLDDLSFSEQHAASAPLASSVRIGSGGGALYPMETNVATMLMLRHPPGGAAFAHSSDGSDGSDGSVAMQVTSRPMRRPHRMSSVVASSSPLRPAPASPNVRPLSHLLRPAATAGLRVHRPSQKMELSIQSGSVRLKEANKLDPSPPINEQQVTRPADELRVASAFRDNGEEDPMIVEEEEEEELRSTAIPMPKQSSSIIRHHRQPHLPNSESSSCLNPKDFQCQSGTCVSSSSRCNQVRDCPDNSDEEGCVCADYLNTQSLKDKICDGIVDCWDYSDENRCPSCTPDMYVCPNVNMCVASNKVCDSRMDCPGGEDEKHCVRISANQSLVDDGNYQSVGYLMLQKNGAWGLLCADNLPSYARSAASQDQLQLTELARAVCRSLTFTDLISVERRRAPTLPIARNRTDKFYRVYYIPSNVNSTSRSVLEFNETSRCRSRDTLWINCKNLECGTRPMSPSARIVGGSNARAGSWPWQAAMYKSGEYMCGATLINDMWLVSAAHCFFSEVDNHWTARLGMLRRGSQAPSEQIKQISHIHIHANYVKVGFVNDVALLRMHSPVTFSDFIRPACLPSVTQESIYNGRVCTVVGWGQLMEAGHVFPDTLQEVDLPVFTAEECRKKTVFLQTYQITDNMFCAGFDRGGRDACLGDSGGPLVCQETDGKWSLVGVTSNGFGCARAWRPGIYTKVSNYIGWINAIMAGPLKAPVRSYCRGHRCQLGKCLPPSSVCNGYVECLDGSDEHSCS